MTPKTYVFFGNVGAGKGTQIDLLQKEMALRESAAKIVYIYPGNQFRTLVKEGGYTGGLVKEALEAGKLQPIFLTSWVFTQELLQMTDPATHLLVDGFPRTLEQVMIFNSAMTFYDRKNIELVYIEVSKDEVIKRMKLRARSDDTDEGIAQRFHEYETNVIPAMKALQEQGHTLHTINGAQSVEAVHEEVKKALGL